MLVHISRLGQFQHFIKRLKSGQKCFCTDALRDFLSFDDFMVVIERILNMPFETATYNISSGRGHTIKDVYDAVASHLGMDPEGVEVRPCGADDVQEVVLDPSAAEKKFGWKARDNFQTLMQQQLDWYDHNGVGRDLLPSKNRVDYDRRF